ncbi:fimbrial protein [Erwinia sp. CGal63]|uniref:fimbrial protein n=1 Tax=Erwinia sp. CGal63 TaxID=2919889 RepID=UPI0030083113
MKKLLIVAAMATAFAGVNAQAASGGTITFNGDLNANTCDVVVADQAADATVTLPSVGTSSLTTAGQVAGETKFEMALTNCTGSLTTVSAFFENGDTVDSNGRLLNKATAGAENVVLQLIDYTDNEDSGKIINIGSQDQITTANYATIASGKAGLSYAVRYYANGETTAGTVTSFVNYNLQYK